MTMVVNERLHFRLTKLADLHLVYVNFKIQLFASMATFTSLITGVMMLLTGVEEVQ